jgi:hypothetical protein
MMLAFAFFVALQLAPQPTQVDDGVVVRGRALDMTQVDIRGELVKPSAGWIKVGPRPHKKNLIEMRTNFRPELAKSRDALATAP